MVATGYDEGNYDDDLHGYDENGDPEYQSAASSNCEVIDILNSSKFCANIPSFPVSIWTASGGIVSNVPMICGGELFDDEYQGKSMENSCYIFDLTSNAWKLLAKMSVARSDFASVPMNGALWVTGGSTRKGLQMAKSEDITTEFIYLNGTVLPGPNLPSPRDDHCMVTLHDNRVMILGSENGTTDSKSVIIYEPDTENFSTAPSLQFDRNGAACALFYSPLHENRPVVLAVGGYNTDTAEIYDYTHSNEWEKSKHALI